jgi:hypothetical protein
MMRVYRFDLSPEQDKKLQRVMKILHAPFTAVFAFKD